MGPGNALCSCDRVLVTGGSGGLGRGICEVLVREGARVAFTWSTDAAGAEATAAALGAHPVQLDVRDPDACARAIAQVTETLGGLDVLVNNAGISEAVPFVLLEE